DFRFGSVSFAISDQSLIRKFNAGAAIAASNRSVMIEFQVDDVDAVHEQVQARNVEIAMPPTDMPWGNRSMLLRDPDGNVVNVFVRGQRG
ncbi:MAG: VOC family protein, partial [Devosia sp.]